MVCTKWPNHHSVEITTGHFVMFLSLSLFCYLYNARAMLLGHLLPSYRVLTDDIVSRVFIGSSALEQVVAKHPGNAAEWTGLVSSQTKPVDLYFQEVMFSG
ncbi:hypothetical protein TNCV_3003051 [Trichonephila clavipes]|nr:hypothetical protein TNCV_3003051 [Trichonephila clavipes]